MGISTIPALLELAVVLFLCGLVILLWTVDEIVAIAITIATGLLLSIVSAVTVLPAVFRRCPYKSPTGWACVFVYDIFKWTLQCVWWLITNYQWGMQGLTTMRPRFQQYQSWRQRDLSLDELASNEAFDYSDVEVDVEDLAWVDQQRLTIDICEALPLFRALAWVRTSSEDVNLLKHVAKSAKSLHTDRTGLVEQYYSFLYLMRKLISAKVRQLQPLAHIVDGLKARAYKTVWQPAGEAYVFRGGVEDSAANYMDPPLDQLLGTSNQWVLAYLLFSDTVDFLITEDGDNLTDSGQIANLVSLLRHFIAVWDNCSFRVECCAQLANIYMEMGSSFEYHLSIESGVHTMVLETLSSISNIRWPEGEEEGLFIGNVLS